jgi:hypothetical protein
LGFQGVQITSSKQANRPFGDGNETGDGARQVSPAATGDGRESHTVEEAADAGLGSIEISVSVEPQHGGGIWR